MQLQTEYLIDSEKCFDFHYYYFSCLRVRRLDISYTRVEMDRWDSVQARSNEIVLDADRDGQSLNNDNESPMNVCLRKHKNSILIKSFGFRLHLKKIDFFW